MTRDAEQLALDVADYDGLTFDEWVRSLPTSPGSQTTVGEALAMLAARDADEGEDAAA